MPRVAICFFGMIRNIALTLQSIRTNLTEPLQREHATEIFVHSLSVAQLTDARSMERNVSVRAEDALALTRRSETFEIESQALVDETYRFAAWRGFSGFPHASSVNAFRSKYSLHRVARLAVAYERRLGVRFDYVAFARPDTRIVGAVELLPNLSAVAVPGFHHWGGVNDRFALGPRDLMIHAYASQFAEMHRLRGGWARNTEAFLCEHLATHGVARVAMLPMRVIRVRANGRVVHRDVAARYETCQCRSLCRWTHAR